MFVIGVVIKTHTLSLKHTKHRNDDVKFIGNAMVTMTQCTSYSTYEKVVQCCRGAAEILYGGGGVVTCDDIRFDTTNIRGTLYDEHYSIPHRLSFIDTQKKGESERKRARDKKRVCARQWLVFASLVDR